MDKQGPLRTNVFPEQFGQVENLASLYGFWMNLYFSGKLPNFGRRIFFFLTVVSPILCVQFITKGFPK